MPLQYFQLTEHLFVHRDCINVGILCDGERALLIDCGNGDVKETLNALGITTLDTVLFTHHHRDGASGFRHLRTRLSPETRVGVPAGERPWFDSVETFWNEPKNRSDSAFRVFPLLLHAFTSGRVMANRGNGTSFR